MKGSSETVTVEGAGQDLLENTSTFHTDVDRGLFDKMPLESRSSSVSSLVTLSSPGIAADSNGLFHGLATTRRIPSRSMASPSPMLHVVAQTIERSSAAIPGDDTSHQRTDRRRPAFEQHAVEQAAASAVFSSKSSPRLPRSRFRSNVSPGE